MASYSIAELHYCLVCVQCSHVLNLIHVHTCTDTHTGTHSQQLGDAGVVPGADMTAEAGLTKVSYLVARSDLDYETKQQVCHNNA